MGVVPRAQTHIWCREPAFRTVTLTESLSVVVSGSGYPAQYCLCALQRPDHAAAAGANAAAAYADDGDDKNAEDDVDADDDDATAADVAVFDECLVSSECLSRWNATLVYCPIGVQVD